jgi:hypothetical protein
LLHDWNRALNEIEVYHAETDADSVKIVSKARRDFERARGRMITSPSGMKILAAEYDNKLRHLKKHQLWSADIQALVDQFGALPKENRAATIEMTREKAAGYHKARTTLRDMGASDLFAGISRLMEVRSAMFEIEESRNLSGVLRENRQAVVNASGTAPAPSGWHSKWDSRITKKSTAKPSKYDQKWIDAYVRSWQEEGAKQTCYFIGQLKEASTAKRLIELLCSFITGMEISEDIGHKDSGEFHKRMFDEALRKLEELEKNNGVDPEWNLGELRTTR